MKLRERTTDFGSFARRHIGPSKEEMREMLRDFGFENLDALIDAADPQNIRLDRELNLPEAKSETEALAELHAIAKKNKVARSFIGAGYYDCITPPVIQRNILENPGWYTAYTPYQAELAQGRLEALVNFQTMDRFDWARYRKRVSFGRSDRRRRSDVALSCGRFRSKQIFRRRQLSSPNYCRHSDPREAAWHPDQDRQLLAVQIR